MTCDVWRVAYDVWRVTCDVWRETCNFWCSEFGSVRGVVVFAVLALLHAWLLGLL